MLFKKAVTIIMLYLYFLSGLTVMTFGIYLTIMTKSLGVSPWDVFHLGISNYFPLSLGVISQLVGVVVIILSLCLGIKPRLGTVLNIYITGVLLNVFLNNHLVPVPKNATDAYVYLIIGTFINGFGSAMYISANLGAGPRDSLMLGLHQKTGLRVAVVRTITEITAVISGVLLNGPFGIGTIAYSILIGPSVEVSLSIIRSIQRGKTFHKLQRYLQLVNVHT